MDLGPHHLLRSQPVSSVNPEREARRLGKPTDPLRLFERDFQILARCRRPGCSHVRELAIGLLLSVYGRDAPLGAVAARMRCSHCAMRGARLEVKYIGRPGDGR